MAKFLVTYDLRGRRDYDPLYAYLQGMSKAGRILESVWLIETSLQASELRDQLKARTDSDDGLFVASVAAPAAWSKPDAENKWILGFFE